MGPSTDPLKARFLSTTRCKNQVTCREGNTIALLQHTFSRNHSEFLTLKRIRLQSDLAHLHIP